jgi:hypothetical protein
MGPLTQICRPILFTTCQPKNMKRVISPQCVDLDHPCELNLPIKFCPAQPSSMATRGHELKGFRSATTQGP